MQTMWKRVFIGAPILLVLLLAQFFYAKDQPAKKVEDPKKKAAPQTPDSDQEAENQTQTQEANVNYDVLLEGTYSGLSQPLTQVVNNQKEWGELWKKHTALLVPQPPPPQVDFNSSVVAVIASGEKRTSGFKIVLKKLAFQGQDIVVDYQETQPPQNSLTLQVITQPFLMLRIQKPEKGGTVRLLKSGK